MDASVARYFTSKYISVSINANQGEGMNWLQLTANKTERAKHFGVQRIPRILLLDKEGKIIADKLRGESIRLELERVINNGQ